MAYDGLLKVQSNAELEKQEKSKASEKYNTPQIMEQVTGLRKLALDTWEANKSARTDSGVEKEMLDNAYQRNSEYTPEKLAELVAAGGTKVFTGLTGVKCRGAESWFADILLSDRDKTWYLEPSPMPDLPPYAEKMITERAMIEWVSRMQQGQEMSQEEVYKLAAYYRDEVDREVGEESDIRAKRMERLIDDQMTEGKFYTILNDLFYDITTFKVGMVRGAVPRRIRRLRHSNNLESKKHSYVTNEISQVWYRVNPFDIFPADGAVDCEEGGFIERTKYWLSELANCRSVKGYDKEVIEGILLNANNSDTDADNTTPIDSNVAALSDKESSHFVARGQVEALDIWIDCLGHELIADGITKDFKGNAVERLEEYPLNIILCKDKIIYKAMNYDPLGRRPYYKTGMERVSGSFWYKGIPELMRDIQTICNAVIRALVTNVSMASGPQLVINDIMRMAKNQNITSLQPYKIWQFVNSMHTALKPIDFFQPDMHAHELIRVYELFSRLADDWTGIPAYQYGNERVAGAGRTASGLNMLMSASAKNLRRIMARIDQDIIQEAVKRQYDWNMLYWKDESVKGDLNIQPKGLMNLIVKESMAAQRLQFLANTNNPLDQRIIGIEGRANAMREAAEALQMRDKVVPDKDKVREIIAEIEAEKAAMAQAQTMQAQLAMESAAQQPAQAGGEQQ